MKLPQNGGDRLDFTIELETIAGAADSGVLDRLADLVYEISAFSDVLMGLNPDGSVRASFVVSAATSIAAAEAAVDAFVVAFVAARPLRPPEQWAGGVPAGGVPRIGVVPTERLMSA